jgi:hypothetical protein
MRYDLIWTIGGAKRRDEAIQYMHRGTGLLRGACHRAGHFGPDPLARNDEAPIGATLASGKRSRCCAGGLPLSRLV